MTLLKKNSGFSLVELLVVLGIFSAIFAVVFSSYITQLKHTGREYRVAEAEIEIGIAKGIIERDVAMAGYGIAEDYGATGFNPKVASASNNDTNNSDTLTITGTALGMKSKQAQAWTYINGVNPTFGPASTADTNATWSDSRENLETNDRVVLMEPSTKKLMSQGTEWLFKYDPSNVAFANRLKTLSGGITYSTPSVGTLVYGLCGSSNANCNVAGILQPYYAVRYYLSNSNVPLNCASGTYDLLRAESKTSSSPGSGDPILECVRDMEVAFGLDTDENGAIDAWDDGGVIAAGYAASDLRKRLKQVRMYILVQSGNYDANYTSPFTSVRVGDTALGAGMDVTLTSAQLNYRWRMLAISITPRNIR